MNDLDDITDVVLDRFLADPARAMSEFPDPQQFAKANIDTFKAALVTRGGKAAQPKPEFSGGVAIGVQRHIFVDETDEKALAKAHQHEERGQYSEALGQWEILRTIYGQYPGLSFEIERVTKHDVIAFTLMVGIVVGTYSSVFIASSLVITFTHYQEKKAKAAQPNSGAGGKRFENRPQPKLQT